jgi:hypothetical protein
MGPALDGRWGYGSPSKDSQIPQLLWMLQGMLSWSFTVYALDSGAKLSSWPLVLISMVFLDPFPRTK